MVDMIANYLYFSVVLAPMNKLLTLSLLVIISSFFCTEAGAEGKFCYRVGGTLSCHSNIEKIPEEFQKKAFFVSSELEARSSSSVKKESSRPSLSSNQYEIISPPSDARRLTVQRDRPLSESTTKPLHKDPIPNPETARTETESLEIDSAEISRTATNSVEITPPAEIIASPEIRSPVPEKPVPGKRVQNSGLPPAKGYDGTPHEETRHDRTRHDRTPGGEPAPELPIVTEDISKNETSKNSTPALVEIYVAEWCSHCKALERFLTQEKIAYKKFDVEKDPQAMQLYEVHGSIPLSKIGNNIVVGFEAERYRALIDASLPY